MLLLLQRVLFYLIKYYFLFLFIFAYFPTVIFCERYNAPEIGKPLPERSQIKGGIGNGRILCVIHTAAVSHDTLAKTVYDIWGKKCDDTLFFTDSPIDWEVPHIYFPRFTTRKHSWEKIRNVMRFVYHTTLGKYDWYLRADDDAFVFVDNARKFLRRYDPAKNYLFGFRWGFFEPKGFADGSTYVMSWKTLESFVNITYDDNLCPEFHRAEEDQELSRCLAKINITPSDARDYQGRDRFHQFHPEELNDFGRTIFMNRHSYYQFLGYPDHISPTTIGLHHLSPYEMRFMDFLVHKAKISDT